MHHPSEHRNRLLAGAALSMVGVASSVNPLAVCLTSIGRTFGDLAPGPLGLIATITFAGVVAGIILAGPCADRWGLRRFMILGAVVQVLGLFGMSVAPGFKTFLAVSALTGLGSGMIDALASPLVSDLAPGNRTRALNWLHACYPVGAVLMILGSSFLLGRYGSWRVVFPVMSLPTAASLILFSLSRFPQHQGRSFQISVVASLWREPAFRIGILGIFMAGATESSVAQWTPAYMEKVFSWSAKAGAHVLLGFSLGMTLGRLGTGGLARRFRPSLLMLCSALGCAGCMAISSVCPAGFAAAALILDGFFVSCLWPTTLAYVADRLPNPNATVFSLLATSGNSGFMVAPSVIGFVATGAGLRWGFALSCIFPLLAAAAFAWVEIRRR